MNHLQLEREIANELSPVLVGMGSGPAPRMRRETVFAMLSQPDLQSHSFADLMTEAGHLATAALQLESFASAEIVPGKRLRFRLGPLADVADNVSPSFNDVDWNVRRSAFSYALEAGHAVVIENASHDSRFLDSNLVDRGIRSGVVCPISYRDQQYGAIGYFAHQQRQFSKDDVAFLQSVSLFLGAARAHQNAEKSLTIQSRFLSEAIDSLEAIVALLDADGRVLQINRTCQILGGFAPEEIRGRRIWSAFWQPEECNAAESAVAKARQGAQQVKCEAHFVTKRGGTRRVAWTMAGLQDGGETGPAILACGIDITEQYQAFKKIQELERLARNASLEGSLPTELARPELSPGEDDPRNRRCHDRRPFPCIQMVAPCLGGVLPTLDQFCEVRCYDICPSGFSFLRATRPPFDELVVAFGSVYSRLYLQSQVKHVTPVHFEGRHTLLIGCEYVRRVRIPSTS